MIFNWEDAFDEPNTKSRKRKKSKSRSLSLIILNPIIRMSTWEQKSQRQNIYKSRSRPLWNKFIITMQENESSFFAFHFLCVSLVPKR